jgi:hypothetical protein
MPEESKRLFFGNSTKPINMKPMPQGERKCFGEPQPVPATAPKVNENSKVLCFGNHAVQTQPDVPFQVMNGQLRWQEKPQL